MLDGGSSLRDGFEHVIERFRMNFGEKSQRAEIHAEQWHVDGGGSSRRREQGAIATQHDDKIQWSRSQLGARQSHFTLAILRGLQIRYDFVTVVTEPAQKTGHDLCNFRTIWTRNNGCRLTGGLRL